MFGLCNELMNGNQTSPQSASGDKPKPPVKSVEGRCEHFDHITFWVSNAKQAASYYCVHLGFEALAYKGLETGSRQVVAHVVRQQAITLVFVSPLTPNDPSMGNHLVTHGDGVKDIAFSVDDIEVVLNRSVERGAKVLKDITTDADECGKVRTATVKTFGDVTHTFVERSKYTGLFLPGYKCPVTNLSPLLNRLPPAGLQFIDHVVGSQDAGGMSSTEDWYEKSLAFHRFWSVDDVNVQTKFSALNFVVVANDSETIKLNILEPAPGLRKSQVQEFNEYYGGPGIQHIALHTDDIIKTITILRERGLEFLSVPDAYYVRLRERLATSKLKIKEPLEELAKLKILLDYDEKGYLLQIFTKPMQDRPTLFFEVIQRRGHNGFGAGNFRALFEAVEVEQAQRGNLY